MAVIINLKEIFASDAQEIFTDKVNFNFNKLLELGIGEQGIQGLQGPVGAAGPPGIPGDEGQRGNKWFVGVGDPNTQVFIDLIEGDFYLETNESAIWQYNGSPLAWVQVTDLSEVVVNILETEGSPFIRGFGEASPLDDRFITFTRRGNDPADIIADTTLGNNSNNDTLLLTNWNERVTTIDNFPLSTDEEFNAIQAISLDHTSNPLGRYHLEFSSVNSISGQTELSSLNHNLKIRYLKEQNVSSNYPVSNQFINIARFSLSIPETVSPVNIDEQGIFEFVIPKYQDIADGSPVKDDVLVRIGSSETVSDSTSLDIAVDGIDISFDSKAINFGLIRELESFTSVGTLPLGLAGEFGLISTSDLVAGLVLRGDTYQAKGSLNSIHVDSEYESTNIATGIGAGTTAQGFQGIFSDGKYLIAVSPGTISQENVTANGYIRIFDITNPDDPISWVNKTTDSTWPNSIGAAVNYDIHGNPQSEGDVPGYSNSLGLFADIRNFPLTGVRDIAFAGKYGVMVRRAPSPTIGTDTQVLDSFIVFELDSDLSDLKLVSMIGQRSTFTNFMAGSVYQGTGIPELDESRRVKISGNYAYVLTSPETATVGTSYFAAVDITNPARPYINSTYIETYSQKRPIDFDIEGEVAYILSYNEYDPSPLYRLEIIKKSIFDPTGLNSSIEDVTGVVNFAGGLIPNEANGSIKVSGRRAYVVYDDTLYIYNTGDNIGSGLSLISSTILAANHTGYDIEISGKFAYVYAQESVSQRSAILTYDISNDSSPLLLEPISTFASADGNGAPSKMTLVGDRIFTIAASNGTELAGVNSVKLDGISSPIAQIGNIHSNNIKVAKNISVAETLQVGRSATIGSGGLWVDNGEGIHVAGEIVCKPQFSDEFDSSVTGIETEISGAISVNSTLSGIIGNTILITDSDLTASLNTILVGQAITIQDSDFTSGGGLNSVIGLDINFSAITTGGDIVGLDISGEDTNILSGDLEVGGAFKGSFQTGTLNGAPSTTQIASVPGEDVFSSGVFGAAAGLGVNYTDGRLVWQRVGNIVHVKGYLGLDPGASSAVGFLPHDDTTGTRGTAWNPSTGTLYKIQPDITGKFDIPGAPAGATLEISFYYQVI